MRGPWRDDVAVQRLLLLVLAAEVVLFGLFGIGANRFLVDPDLVFTADHAATSLATFDARSFRQVYGTPSWNDYLHPGAFLIYWRAAFETVDQALGLRLGEIATTHLAHLLYVDIILVGMAFAVRHLLDRDLGLTAVFMAAYVAFLVAAPLLTGSTWEPDDVTLLAGWFMVACAAAARPTWHLLPLAVLLGFLGVQLQITFAYPMGLLLVVLALRCVRPFFALPPKTQVAVVAAVAAATALGAYWAAYDVFVGRLAAISKFQAHARVIADRRGVSVGQAADLIAAHVCIPASVQIAFAVALVAVGAIAVIRPSARAEGPPAKSGGMAWVVLFAFLGVAAAALFYLIAATAGYAPRHTSALAYTAFALVVAAAVTVVADRVLRRRPGLMAPIVVLLPAVTFVAMIATSGVDVFRVPLTPRSIVRAPEMGHLLTSIRDELMRRPGAQVAISVAFPAPGEIVSDDRRDLPWRLAVALMNVLRRNGIVYCAGPNADPNLEYAYRVVALFGKTAACGGASIHIPVAFRCDDSGVVAESGGRRYVMAGCVP